MAGRNDHLIVEHRTRGLEILLFYRKTRKDFDNFGFRYEGQFEYLSHHGSAPTHFKLRRAIASDEAFQRSVADVAAATLDAKATGKGQGFLSRSDVQDAIEQHAMSAARAYFEGLEFHVEDTSNSNPFDFIVRSEGLELFVEVKGTTSRGDEVILTRNEVEHARQYSAQSVLFILANIICTDGASGPVASGGKRRLFQPWKIDEGQLKVISYTYRP